MKASSKLILGGMIIILAGLAYDVVFIGMIPQDASMEIINKREEQRQTSDVIIYIGLAFCILGVFTKVFFSGERTDNFGNRTY
ncbi:hypothetical protein [Flavobacterium sp. NRK1]|jgi:hypothetical protein|uniref:hypothetical protein n=1 Tax=Flavobacterium sp. NRK1 TaxID=2954929 RepID=UPI0020930299|nr:hypothetical protein [Flavobacterium sp. NRK1]MCO6146499.1 hypothetical protein [Flavobacterium sp. NRK1]